MWVSRKTYHLWKMPLLVHAPDIPQVTAQGNKSRVTGQEMCCHMYLPSPGVTFHSCEWVRRRWKPFSTPCLHSFLLKSAHKLTHRCCNMNLFPLSLPLGLSVVTFFTFLSWPVSLFYFTFSFGHISQLFFHFLSLSLSKCRHLWTCSLAHSDQCQTGNVPSIYTVESTGA